MSGGECLCEHAFRIVFLPVPFVVVPFANRGRNGNCSRFCLFEVQRDNGVALCSGLKRLCIVARCCISGVVPSECAVLAYIIRPLRLYPAFASYTEIQCNNTVAPLCILGYNSV